MFSIALYQPQIPPNTGNIIRLCANTGYSLDLIGPLGFSMDQKQLRRAGLDYHEFSEVKCWEHWEDFQTHNHGRLVSFSTRSHKNYCDFEYQPKDVLLFGSETKGLPQHVRDQVAEVNQLTIPMQKQSRSLNLSNSVAIVAYEAWRQHGFRS
jgi:tRNA (cytidine/uridine-2'-O-)-methyltransferase